MYLLEPVSSRGNYDHRVVQPYRTSSNLFEPSGADLGFGEGGGLKKRCAREARKILKNFIASLFAMRTA